MSAAPSRLADFSQLHAAVRAWLARDFAAPADAVRLPQNLAYADLVFAFGYARLGDANRARQLLADATIALGPGGAPAIVLPFFRYRIGEAIAGRPHAGPAAGCTIDGRPDLPHHAPERLHAYVAIRLLGASKAAEPDEVPNPYADWMRQSGPIEQMVYRLIDRSRASVAADEVAELFEALDRKADTGAWVWALKNLSGAAVRADAACRRAMLRRMRAVYGAIQERPTTDESYTSEHAVAEFLCATVEVARLVPDPTAVDDLTATAVAAICDGWSRNNFQTAARMAGECVRAARLLGLRATVGIAADRLAEQFSLKAATREWSEGERPQHRWNAFLSDHVPQDGYERQVAYLRLQLVIAEAGRWVGWADQAAATLDVARTAMELWPRRGHHATKELRLLPATACQYLRAVGAGEDPAAPRQMCELFKVIPPVPSTFQTAPYFSRLHLEILDTAVLAFPGVYAAP